jgi:hypothetical protein
LTLFWLVSGSLLAAEWGDLSGQFVYDGEPPEPAKLRITKDEEECCKHDLVDESLVVDDQTRGLKNVVIYLYPGRGESVPVHESYEAQRPAVRTLDNLACRFDPRVLLLWTPQTLLVGNSDPIGHNAMIDTRKNRPINVTIPSGGQYKHTFPIEEREPVSVSCSIHPWMRGWVLVRDTPYMASSDRTGKFVIKNLPVGDWEFGVWHESGRFLTKAVRDGNPVAWKRGRFKIEIGRGNNDLGVVSFSPELFR